MKRKKGTKTRSQPASGGVNVKNKFFKYTGRISFNNTVISERTVKVILVILFSSLAALLLIGPFYRGLFFPVERLYAMIFIFGILVAWGILRILSKDSHIISTPLDFSLIVLLLAYSAAFFVAANKRDALEEILKISSYIVVYMVSIDICRRWGRIKARGIGNFFQPVSDSRMVPPGLSIVLHLLLVAATVITIASLGAAAGHWDFIGAYASSRIASPMGYANAAAAYFMASYLLAVGLAPLVARRFRIFYLAPAAMMLMALVLTFSRGAWLLLPPLALLLVLLAAPGERLRIFLYLFATAISAVPAAFLVDPIFRSDIPARFWLLIVPAAFLAVLFGYLAEQYLQLNRKRKKKLAAAAAFILGLVLFFTVGLPALSPLQLEFETDEQADELVIKQVVNDISPGETYELNVEVNALIEKPSPEISSNIWGLRVLGGVPGYRDVELLDYGEGPTDGWEERIFNFDTAEDMTRLEVQIYNYSPGATITAREVVLSSGDEKENLHFIMNRVLPKRFYDRLFSYSLDRNMDRRLELFRDAVKVIKDYPLLGTGGGGWAALYYAYQEQPYSSREIHNHFLQVWVEAGLFGFLAFVGIWISFAAAFVKNCLIKKAPPRLWQYWTAAFVPVVALGAHSTIDWNFSLMAVGIYLFVFLGAGRSLDQNSWFKKGNNETKSKGRSGLLIGIITSIIGLMLFVFTVNLSNGLRLTWDSQELMEAGNLKSATTLMERAIRLDPLRAENYHNLGVLEEDKFNRTQYMPSLEKALNLAEKAHQLEPYNVVYVSRYGNLLFGYVDAEEGLAYLDRAIELRPFEESVYLQAAWTRVSLIEYLVNNTGFREAEKYMNEIENLAAKMETVLGDSKPLYFLIGRALYLLGEPAEALEYLHEIKPGETFYSEARLLLDRINEEKIINNQKSY